LCFYFFETLLDKSRGDKTETRGTAFVIYEDIYDAKNAVDHLSGFNVCGRYLIVLYYQPTKMQKNVDNAVKKKEIEEMKAKFGLNKSKEEL
jgi:pre-mRNA branch site protein p14